MTTERSKSLRPSWLVSGDPLEQIPDADQRAMLAQDLGVFGCPSDQAAVVAADARIEQHEGGIVVIHFGPDDGEEPRSGLYL
jgi:hypothetical protein